MILVADSGSTKTTWAVVGSDNKCVTDGLNPHFSTDGQFFDACSAVSRHFALHSPLSALHFYGAGCGSEEQRVRVQRLLCKAFDAAEVTVETDMLGACHATCGHEAGLVGILGTGSNACYYDGEGINYKAVSTGFILGDEGSANHVGRRLLQDYLCGVMPVNLTGLFHDAYPMSYDELLDMVYHRPNANRFLASLAKFAVEHIDNPYCSSQIYTSLCNWYDYQLMDLWERTHCRDIYFVGGFAARIRPLLDRFAKECDLRIRAVVADPMDGLLRYHG